MENEDWVVLLRVVAETRGEEMKVGRDTVRKLVLFEEDRACTMEGRKQDGMSEQGRRSKASYMRNERRIRFIK